MINGMNNASTTAGDLLFKKSHRRGRQHLIEEKHGKLPARLRSIVGRLVANYSQTLSRSNWAPAKKNG